MDFLTGNNNSFFIYYELLVYKGFIDCLLDKNTILCASFDSVLKLSVNLDEIKPSYLDSFLELVAEVCDTFVVFLL